MQADGPAIQSDPRRAMIDWARFTALVQSSQAVLLTTHIRPDADAIGSTLAMGEILRQVGKAVSIVADFEVPPRYRFLDPSGKIQGLGREVAVGQLPAFDLLLVLDTSAWAQLGAMGEVLRSTSARKAALDHHLSADDLGAELFRDTSAEATGRLVYEAARHLGVRITPQVATWLFAALATDTGWFRFNSTSAETYRLAAELAEAGVVPHQMYRDLYENDTLGRLQLTGRAMARAQSDLAGRLIYTWLEQDDFQASGALPSESEDIINLTFSVGVAEVAAMFVEQQAGATKVSLRSRGSLDCSRIVEQFGGGGHHAAAGVILPQPLPVVRDKLLGALRAAMGPSGFSDAKVTDSANH